MLAQILEKLIMNRGKIGGALMGLVLGLIYINSGFLNTLIVAFFVLVGYNYAEILSKIRLVLRKIDRFLKIILKKLREDD